MTSTQDGEGELEDYTPPAHGKSLSNLADYRIQKMGSRMRYIDKRRNIDKIISFDPSGMLGFSSMARYYGTVFEFSMVRVMIFSTILLGAITCGITLNLPSSTDTDFNSEKLTVMIKFLMTFLAFMVSIFVNGAFNRWQYILTELALLSQKVKMLYIDCVMHNVPRAGLHDVRRWGIASVWMTAVEAPACWSQPKWSEVLKEMQEGGLLTADEKEKLLEFNEGKATLIWVWITLKLRELSEQQFVPPRNTPALARMQDHCHDACAAISHIFNAVLLQVPHQYVHMLALLINLLNIVNTVKCGIELGHLYARSTVVDSAGSRWLTAMEVQSLVAYVGIMLLAPLVYQSFLSISVDIMIPFGDGSTDIPTLFLVKNLSTEIDDFEESVNEGMLSRSPSRLRQATE